MMNASTFSIMFCRAIAAAIFVIASPAFTQTPTDGQRSAIRAECRSDYEAHCANVPQGGMASLQCLQKNMSSLSAGCQSAVRAVEASPAPKTEPPSATTAAEPAPEAAPNTETATAKPSAEPAPAAPKASSSATAKQPSSAQVGAIRTACRADYPKVCAGVPSGGAPALQCLEKNKAKLSANCQKAVAGAGLGAATAATDNSAAAAGTAAVPATAPPVLVLRPMLPREEIFVLRSACGADVRALCAGVAPGGGRIVHCLATRSASLSPECRGVLSEFAAR